METKPKPKPVQRRAIGYARISKDRDEQSSIKNQVDAITKYCDLHGIVLVDVIVEKGRSAFKENRSERTGFKKGMAYITAGAADTWVTWKLDRTARNTLDLLKFVREDLAKYNAEFVSVTESFDTTTAIGRAMMVIVAALAEMESAQKSERALSWQQGRRDEGLIPTGRTSFGYIKEGKTLVKNPLTAPLIEEAARRLIDGDSVQSIFHWLNAQEGIKVSRPGVLTLLQSPTIAGYVCMEPMVVRNGQRIVPEGAQLKRGAWDPILDRETWDEVRVILRDPKRRVSTSNRLAHPLRPIIRCACGGSMPVAIDKRANKANRYVCSVCRNGITQKPVDDLVFAAVLDHLDDGAWRSLRAGGKSSGPDPEQIEADLARMWQSVLERKLDHDEYTEARTRWYGELAAAQTEPADLPDVASIREAWNGGTLGAAEKHLVLRRAIKSLVIAPSTKGGRFIDPARIVLELTD